MIQIAYNKKYNLQIIWLSEDTLPIFIDRKSGKEIKPFVRKSNTDLHYPCLSINGEIQYCHRIVKYTFSKGEGYSSGYVVDHINGNTMDYRPSNLRYLSRSDNARNLVGHEDENAVKQPKISLKWDK